ncbi:hypothetical protein IDF50_25835 [Klebsiella pneumoniae]|uniref:hypothetical protein n=1 Tax=Klebsiella pneumoniae TaxID=573 RepID=UPI00296EA588|nr:hypothetical protein [Klebsiella pneumoniae]MDW3815824.1 hypothetical protein [Klebsiella pneumoniae]
MKEQMQHQLSKTDSDRGRQEALADKPVNCHLKLSAKADGKLLKIQHLLRAENIKLSKHASSTSCLKTLTSNTLVKIYLIFSVTRLETTLFRYF